MMKEVPRLKHMENVVEQVVSRLQDQADEEVGFGFFVGSEVGFRWAAFRSQLKDLRAIAEDRFD